VGRAAARRDDDMVATAASASKTANSAMLRCAMIR